MLAEDFGYQLSPKAAKKMTPAVQAEAGKAIEDGKRATAKAESGRKSAEAFLVVLFLLGVVLAVAIPSFLMFAVAFVWLLLSSAVGKSSIATAKAHEERLREMITPVLNGRWQAWPCRMESVPGQTRRRVVLLDPGGADAVVFVSSVPQEAWMGTTDGRGLVWFVGDLRFGGLMALPGGAPLWWTGPPVVDQKPSQPVNSVQHTLEEELTKQAVKFAFDKWLH